MGRLIDYAAPGFYHTLFIAQGTPVTEVQTYLGHSDPTITLKVYSHWLKQVKTDALARFSARVLSGNWTPLGHQSPAEPEPIVASA